MSDSLDEIIVLAVASTAEWRRRKAKEFPEDARNVKAAGELERLTAEIELLEGSAIHKQIIEATANINGAHDVSADIWPDVTEALSTELRSIGFHNSYETGLQLLEWYRDLLQEAFEEVLDEAVPIPNLDEQVANDPVVKAAKKAYQEAYAKAYAEARKKL